MRDETTDSWDRLSHILDSIERVKRYVEGMTFEEFSGDEKTIDAVVRNIEIIGEAARNVPQWIRADHPELPWRHMWNMRNILIHDYTGVDVSVVWETVTEDLPYIEPLIRRILSEQER